MRSQLHLLLVPGLTLALTASCIAAGADSDRDLDNDPPLADVDELFAGSPESDEIPREFGKFDDLLPRSHDDLHDLVSPVRSQARRGVCSIFSTVALMEHLYLVEGTIANPDFSEQYLQWSAKFEVRSFPRTSGSNANFNLRAINRFGIPAEGAWPYEGSQWDASDDEACTGEDDQPTRCYTNGAPDADARGAERFFLPNNRFLSARDLKGHIHATGTGVVVGMTFFYQSWNHRRSELPINSDNWDRGIVLYPNEKDREVSLENRAGHSIFIYGWDDDMEVQRRDANGDGMVDADGDPITEKGFYLFKNSWGTSGFGIDHEKGPGFGWISQRYIRELGRVRIAGLPRVRRPVEICDDDIDNDFDGDIDCDDSACAADSACANGVREVSFTGAGADIPDDDPAGTSSNIRVPGDVNADDRAGTISELTISVDISHTFRGDLQVSLHRGGQAVVLHDKDGGGADDLVGSFVVTDFKGQDLAGDWDLVITDNAAIDTGRLNGWTLTALVADE